MGRVNPTCCQPGAPAGVGNVGLRPKPINLPAANKITINMPHIQSGHIQGGSRAMQQGAKKTLFPQNMTAKQVEKAILDAYKNCTRVRTEGNFVFLRGTSRDGIQIEMRMDLQTNVIYTAFPIY